MQTAAPLGATAEQTGALKVPVTWSELKVRSNVPEIPLPSAWVTVTVPPLADSPAGELQVASTSANWAPRAAAEPVPTV